MGASTASAFAGSPDDTSLALDKGTVALLEQIVAERRRRKVEKRCPRCRQTKALSEFNRNRTCADGVQQYCRDCWNARLDEKMAQMTPAARRRWEHDRYMRHRRHNVRRIWEYWTRGRLASADLYVDDIDREQVFARDNGICGICRQPIDPTIPPHHADSFTIDHIQPLSRGGEHSYANVRAAHLRCNVSEANRLARLRKQQE
jgi:5-methylcytosine-specific restriction endonuclease McrA